MNPNFQGGRASARLALSTVMAREHRRQKSGHNGLSAYGDQDGNGSGMVEMKGQEEEEDFAWSPSVHRYPAPCVRNLTTEAFNQGPLAPESADLGAHSDYNRRARGEEGLMGVKRQTMRPLSLGGAALLLVRSALPIAALEVSYFRASSLAHRRKLWSWI